MQARSDYYVVIPARFDSSRFPGKPLVDILGKKLVERVYEQCLQAFPKEKIFVATDDERIRLFCELKQFNVVLTSSRCLTGTDRVAEFAKYFPADFYINVQGDEPLITREDLLTIFNEAKIKPGQIINGMCPIQNSEQFFSVNVPKVVATPEGKLLYMSRAGIPSNKNLVFKWGMRQVCIYSFTEAALLKFSSVKSKTPLEEQEDIEILRFLELGFEVSMAQLSEATLAVDVPSDVTLVESELLKRELK